MQLPRRVGIWYLLLLIHGCATYCYPQSIEPIQTSICTIGRNPEVFDGKIVRVRATVVSGFEIFGVRDPAQECTIALEYADGGPVASVSTGARTPNIQRPPVRMQKNRHFSRMQQLLAAEMHPRERGSICVACHRYEVTATMQGRIDYAGENRGFGHLNMFLARLVLESVSDVTAKDLSSRYEPELYSTGPVRFPTGFLSGRVVTPFGKPVTDGEVTAVSIDNVPLYMKSFTEWTDDKGRFQFALPPGRYVIGLNLENPASATVPYPATYYPDSLEKSSAEVLIISDKQRKQGLLIRVPPPLRQRMIKVRSVWPDGKSIAGANVWLSEVNNSTAVVGSAVSHTKADGTYELVGFEGIDYLVRAKIYMRPGFVPYCAASVLLPSEVDTDRTVLMTFTRSGEICRGLPFDEDEGPEAPSFE